MTAAKHTPHALRHGQALALQYAAQILINVNQEPRLVQRVLSPDQLKAGNAVDTTVLGCNYATKVMLPFIVELALKALVAKHNNDLSEGTHSLCKLYDALASSLQDELNRDFDNIKPSGSSAETRSLREVLVDHDNDFPNWRYLDNAKHLVAASIDALQYVACSVLNVYNSK